MKDKDKEKGMKIKGGNRGGQRLKKIKGRNRKQRRELKKDLKSKMSLKNLMLKHGMDEPEDLKDKPGLFEFLEKMSHKEEE